MMMIGFNRRWLGVSRRWRVAALVAVIPLVSLSTWSCGSVTTATKVTDTPLDAPVITFDDEANRKLGELAQSLFHERGIEETVAFFKEKGWDCTRQIEEEERGFTHFVRCETRGKVRAQGFGAGWKMVTFAPWAVRDILIRFNETDVEASVATDVDVP